MPSSSSGDGGALRIPIEPDAHGQAALLLTESLLHTLVENGMLTPDQAVSVVRTAVEVKVEVATLAGESATRMNASLDLLNRIAQSLGVDGSREGHWPTT